jgi:hypothetical protein
MAFSARLLEGMRREGLATIHGQPDVGAAERLLSGEVKWVPLSVSTILIL